MDFKKLIRVATTNRSEAQSEAAVKRYSTTFSALKKPPRSDVPSEAVLRFLAKKKLEEERKASEARKKKAELLALRSQNTKSSKKAKIMASRTKDNDFSRIKLTEDEMEAKKKRENELLRLQLSDKVARMKARIEMEEKEMLLPRKRKRKSKHGDMDTGAEDYQNDNDIRYVDDSKPAHIHKKMSRKMRKEMELEAILAEMAAEKKKKPYSKDVSKKNRPPPGRQPSDFRALLQLASEKQHEPLKLPEVEVTDSDNRPLTKKQRAQYCEDQARAQRKLETQKAGSSQQVSSKVQPSQIKIPKKNLPKTVDQNNNAVKKNRQDSKNRMPQCSDQVILQPSQRERDFNIPKKSASQKHLSYTPKTETSVPSSHPSHMSNVKRSSNKPPPDSVKSRSSGDVRNQIPKSGAFSRPHTVPQNSKIRNETHSVPSYPEVHNHKVTIPKQQVNGVSKKVKEQQSHGPYIDRLQKKIPHSSGTPVRTEKNCHVQSSKNVKHGFNKGSPPPKQQIKRSDEEQDFQPDDFDLFQPDLVRTQNGKYVKSNKNFKHSENKGNAPLSSSSSKPIKNVKITVQENSQVKERHSAQVSVKKKSIQNVSTTSSNQYISDKAKQPVVNRPSMISRSLDGTPIPGKCVVSDKNMPKTAAHPSLKMKNNMPGKYVPPKSVNLSQPANTVKKVTSMDGAKMLKGKIPNERIPPGRVAPVNRPLSAKPEMTKRPGLPPPRPSVGEVSKRSASKSFHINPYLEPPRRLLEPQRPPKLPMKRRIESDDDDDDDDDDDMSDFIDDGPCYDDTNYSEHIKEIFRYDRSKYIDDDDDDIMETSFAEQMKEEMRSAKLGYLEDLEDMQKEEEEKRRKMMKKKRLKS